MMMCEFFFSSRRRHTRCSRDWSSDVCSSDLMTSGVFLAFIYAMVNSYMPLKRIGYIYQQFQAALGASAKVFTYLDRQEEVSGCRARSRSRSSRARSFSKMSASPTTANRVQFWKVFNSRRGAEK